MEVSILWILNLTNMSYYDKNLDKNKANFVPLTPLSFLERAKDIYPNYEALVYEDRKYTWSEIYKRCIKFASALEKMGESPKEIQFQLWHVILLKFSKHIIQFR